jgi:hypothetical protein
VNHEPGPESTAQLNVRVRSEIAALLQTAILEENNRLSSEGRTERVTKRSLVEHAILKTYGPDQTRDARI